MPMVYDCLGYTNKVSFDTFNQHSAIFLIFSSIPIRADMAMQSLQPWSHYIHEATTPWLNSPAPLFPYITPTYVLCAMG